ncbi:hypothetical protein EVAR_17827_1 [Eumeta japonica]|uniref:Uncharacterized protein n=1 Tax=Eumeta variegata TaxID=151549 RepID=A0A4C1TTJ6_EUMVA|nr:hypothetical protein EVAR_17827_1 [Eumeta japonica]
MLDTAYLPYVSARNDHDPERLRPAVVRELLSGRQLVLLRSWELKAVKSQRLLLNQVNYLLRKKVRFANEIAPLVARTRAAPSLAQPPVIWDILSLSTC